MRLEVTGAQWVDASSKGQTDFLPRPLGSPREAGSRWVKVDMSPCGDITEHLPGGVIKAFKQTE